MKRLRVIVDDIVIHDEPVERWSWTEVASGAIKLEAGPERAASPGLFAQLAEAATRQRNPVAPQALPDESAQESGPRG